MRRVLLIGVIVGTFALGALADRLIVPRLSNGSAFGAGSQRVMQQQAPGTQPAPGFQDGQAQQSYAQANYPSANASSSSYEPSDAYGMPVGNSSSSYQPSDASGTPAGRSSYQSPAPPRRHRSLDREMLIVGGSAGAGTAIGAVAGGGKGAAIGAISGGIAGLVYDLATRNR